MRSLRRLYFKALARSIPIALALAAILLIFSAVFYIVTGGRYAHDEPAPSEDGAPSPTQTQATFRAPTGCLSHASDPAQFLIETQAAASPDDTGAAEFAGAFARWNTNLPLSDKDRVLAATAVNPSQLSESIHGNIPAATATLSGAFGRVVESKNSEAWVDVGLDWFVNQQRQGSIYYSLHLMLDNGHWKVSDINPPAEDDKGALLAKMLPYKNGC